MKRKMWKPTEKENKIKSINRGNKSKFNKLPWLETTPLVKGFGYLVMVSFEASLYTWCLY